MMTSHGNNKLKYDVVKFMNIPHETVSVMTAKTSGFPRKRHLKIVISVMLLRNLNIHQKLCNGTRLLVIGIGKCYINVDMKDKEVHLILRIKFVILDYGYEITRLKFPVKLLCFVMINVMCNDTFMS